MDCQLTPFSTFKSFKTYVPSRGRLEPEYYISSLRTPLGAESPQFTINSPHIARRNMSAERRQDLICGAALLVIWLAVSLPRLSGPIDLRWDASEYYVLGTALAEGKGYRLLNEPGEIQTVHYPPLVPLIVAVHQWLMDTSDFFEVGWRLRILYFVLSGIYLLAVYALARQLHVSTYAWLIAAITGLSFYGFFYPSETLYTELPFALVSILFLLCHRRGDRPVWAAASGVLIVVAYLLRTAAIALLAAWVAESLIRRRFLQAVLRAGVAAVPVLVWQAHIWQVTGGHEYNRPAYPYQRAAYYYSNVTYRENSVLVDPFRPEAGRIGPGELFGRVVRNVIAIPLALGESCWFGRAFGISLWEKLHRKLAIPYGPHWQTAISHTLSACLVSVGLLAVIGAVLTATGREWFLSLYFGLTVGLVALTPFQSNFWRYLAPIAPLTLIFIVTALLKVDRWLAHQRAPVLTAAFSATTTLLLGMWFVQVVIAAYFLRNLLPVSYYDMAGRERLLRLLTYEPQWHSLDRAFEWLRRNTEADAVVATSVPHLAYLRTGHKAVLPPLESDPEQANHLLDEVPVSYLVLDDLGRPPISQHYAAPVVAHRPENWRLVYSGPGSGTKVYQRVR